MLIEFQFGLIADSTGFKFSKEFWELVEGWNWINNKVNSLLLNQVADLNTDYLPKEKKQQRNKIYFRCDTFLLDRIKNTLASQHLAGNYEYPTLSYFFRSALHAYQHGLLLTYQRDLNNPKKEISFRLTEELMTFYNTLPMSSKTLGSYFYKILG